MTDENRARAKNRLLSCAVLRTFFDYKKLELFCKTFKSVIPEIKR